MKSTVSVARLRLSSVVSLGVAVALAISLPATRAKGPQPDAAPELGRPELKLAAGHSGFVHAVAYSPDGQFVATASLTGRSVIVWGAASGIELRRHQLEARDLGSKSEELGLIEASAISIAFTPDSRAVLQSTGLSAVLWDVRTGKDRWRYESSVESFAISPDGELVAVYGFGTGLVLLDMLTGEPTEQALENAGESIGSLAFSADGQRLLIGRAFFSPDSEESELAEDEPAANSSSESEEPAGTSELAENELPAEDSSEGEEPTVVAFDIETDTVVRSYAGLSGSISSVQVSADGRYLLAESKESATAKIWNAADASPLRTYPLGKTMGFASLSPDGRKVAVLGPATLDLFDPATSKPPTTLRPLSPHPPFCAAFSPDSLILLIGYFAPFAIAWDIGAGKVSKHFVGFADPTLAVAFSPDGRSLAISTGNAGIVRVWDLETGKPDRSISTDGDVYALAYSPDGRQLALGVRKLDRKWGVWLGEVRLASLERQTLSAALTGPTGGVTSVAFTPDGSRVVSGNEDGTVHVWDVATMKATAVLKAGDKVNAVAMSPDGQSLLAGSTVFGKELELGESFEPDEEKLLLWQLDGTSPAKSLTIGPDLKNAGPITGVVISPRGSRAVVCTKGIDSAGKAFIIELGTGTISVDLSSVLDEVAAPVVYSPDGRSVLIRESQTSAALVTSGSDGDGGTVVGRFEGHLDEVVASAFSPDGRFLATGSFDGSTRLWDAVTGRQLCALYSLGLDSDVVIAPDGRLDASNLDELPGLYWIMPDDPFRPIRADAFFRDYYEPRLLAKVVNGEPFVPLPPLATLDRTLPKTEILDVKPQPGAPGTVAVRVRITPGRRDGATSIEPAVYDVRLFRDGQIVGEAPRASAEGGTAQRASSNELESWRNATRIDVDPKSGSTIVTFTTIRLRRDSGLKVNQFSAYAFNKDRLKSSTARLSYELPPGEESPRGRAYLVAVGVSACEQDDWSLRYPASDARAFARDVAESISSTGRYETPVAVELVSDELGSSATKANVRAVFDLLSGRSVDPAIVAKIPNGDKLRAARPEDTVLISFSCHGYKADGGDLYLVPFDVGPDARVERGKISPEILEHCISAEELSLWLRDIDAGRMGMAIDACHSGAFAGEAFKPGPMGARGLGQVAYDKGMYVLAATQAESVARGSGILQSGLLLYALRVDGLKKGRADVDPVNGEIALSEWFAYAAKRVPVLLALVIEGAKTGQVPDELRPLLTVQKAGEGDERVQKPVLFAFDKNKSAAVIGRVP